MYQSLSNTDQPATLDTGSDLIPAESLPTPTLPATRHCAYVALLQRGMVAGLSVKALANALAETTGIDYQVILSELQSLARH